MVKHDDHAITWLIRVIHTRHALIMARSWHSHYGVLHAQGIAVMEDHRIMPWCPWSLF